MMTALRPYDSLVPYQGVRVIFTETALEKSAERLFPESKHRSKRILKKLLRRFGGEFRMVPAIFMINGEIYAHPAHRANFKALGVR